MQRGFLNVIFSVVLVATALVCLFFAWRWNAKTGEQAQIALGLNALEESLLESLVRSKIPEGPIDVTGNSLGRTFQFSIKSDQTLTLSRTFASCETYPSEDCGYKVRFVYDPKRATTTYEVTSAYSQAPLSLKTDARSAISRPPSSLPAESSATCNSKSSLAANGYSSNSGLSCLLKPETLCAPGSLPKGITVVGKVPRVEFICGEPSKVARCPAQYSLERIDTRTLGSDGRVDAACVRTTLASVSPPAEIAPAGHISGRVCPYGFKSDSMCQLVNVVSKPGRCGGKGAPVQPVAGKIEFTQNATLGFLDCAVRERKQSCGAQWKADVLVKVRCVLDQPERVDVQ